MNDFFSQKITPNLPEKRDPNVAICQIPLENRGLTAGRDKNSVRRCGTVGKG
jgi:hypothetical protein